MVQRLDIAEPFFHVDYLVKEPGYQIHEQSILINLAERSGKCLLIKGVELPPLKATILADTYVENIEHAFVIKNYLQCNISDVATIQKIKKTWRSLYDCSGLERHKGLPYYKSPKFKTGEGRDHLELNFCFVAEPFAPSGTHRDHDRDFDEVHLQVQGFGKMQKFDENDISTYWGESIMAPGVIHDRMYDAEGRYPWHQYQSVTPCVYVPIELDR